MTAQNNTPDFSTSKSALTKTKKRFPWWLVFILIIGIVVAVGYHYFRQHHALYRQAQLNTNQLATINEQRINQLYQQQQQLITQQDQLSAKLQQVISRDEPVILTNVQFLLQRAQLQLQTESNVKNAIYLLQLAQADLTNVNRYPFNELQQAIADDLTMLQALPVIDVTQLANQFYALNQQVAQLSLALPQAPVQSSAQSRPETGWKKILYNVSDSLRDIVVVERTDQKFSPLLNQQQQATFKQYLQGILQQAVWGALKQNNALYHAALNEAILALKRNVPASNTDAIKLQQQLTELQQVNVEPALPPHLLALAVANRVQQQLLVEKAKVNG